MDESHERYWTLRLNDCKKALEANNFEAFVAANLNQAKEVFFKEILPKTGAKLISWGDSLTLHATGVLEALKRRSDLDVLVTFDDRVSRPKINERRRQALLADLFITGTNAVTRNGYLINLDMIGNRVAAITFGPKNVVIFIGRNKIVADVYNGMARIKNYSAPLNAIRHKIKTPCVKTSFCVDCKSPARICNTWVVTEKSFPKGRIKVVLINEDLGY
ncbi:MAG: lactate utilization protein [Deltaproteobacteria bacterium]|nr:lactate utilization protein [Deltaproteobacteria bacterium]